MAYESNSIFWVEVEKIVPNPFQPRREFDQDKLKELAESVRMYGVLQPLVVTRKEVQLEDGAFRTEYELIAGERRLRASKLAGLTQVPVIIRSGEETELMKLELAIIENLQREDLNPVDRAMAFSQLASAFGLSHTEVAKKVGRSREYVSNSIRLLQLPDTILSALSQREISDGHARTLLMLNDRPEEQDVVFREILLKKLSVREVEKISRKIATDKVRKKNWVDTDPELIEIEKQFTESLGTRVQISKTDYGGKIVIDYFSAEDLQKLLEMVHKEERAAMAAASHASLSSITGATPLEEIASPAEVASREEDIVEDLSKEWETDVIDDEAFAEPIPEIAEELLEEAVDAPVSEVAVPVHMEDLEERTFTPLYEAPAPEPMPYTPPTPVSEEREVTDAYYAPRETAPAPDFIRPITPNPAPFAAEAPVISSAPVSAPTPAPAPVAETFMPAAAQNVPPAPVQEEKKDDDDTLYSLKHFSL